MHCKQDIEQVEVEESFAKRRSFMSLLREHIDEALHTGFDDSVNKYRGRSHFVVINVKSFHRIFCCLIEIFFSINSCVSVIKRQGLV